MNVERPEEQLYRLILEDLAANTEMMREFQSAVVPVILRLDKDVAVLKTDVAMLKRDVLELKTDVAELKSDVAELKSDVAELKSDVAELKSDVAELKSGLRRIEKLLNSRNNGSSSPA